MKKLLAGFGGVLCAAIAWAADGRFEIAQFMMPVTITNSGSYVVTENLTGAGGNGITINASHVTLDLNGFQLAGSGTDNGIISAGRQNIRIVNGMIRNWGKGISMLSSSNCALRDLMVTHSTFEGVEVGAGTLVDDCTLFANGGRGLQVGEASVVTRCVIRNNGSIGLLATNGACVVNQCAIRENGNDGVRAGAASVVVACTSRSNGGNGFDLGEGSQITDSVGYQNDDGFRAAASGVSFSQCVAFNNRRHGFTLGDASLLTMSVADGNLGNGIQAASNNFVHLVNAIQNATNGFAFTGQGNRIEMNHAGLNPGGYSVSATNNLVVRNSASGNGTDYSVVAGNLMGNVTANTNTNGPWVNFTH